MNGQKNPKVEWGFYAVTPRIVRTQYKDLSHAEKWLYTCLRDLCGEKGTCFRSLRALKEETDISIASLSTMIPRLHNAGLVHAEKKRRSASGKEVWHISIIDIWQLNHDACSKNEQSGNDIVQNLNEDKEVVQLSNNDVQNLNEKAGDCSEFERDCSNFSDRRITLKNNITEERTSEEEVRGDVATAHHTRASPSQKPYTPVIPKRIKLIPDKQIPLASYSPGDSGKPAPTENENHSYPHDEEGPQLEFDSHHPVHDRDLRGDSVLDRQDDQGDTHRATSAQLSIPNTASTAPARAARPRRASEQGAVDEDSHHDTPASTAPKAAHPDQSAPPAATIEKVPHQSRAHKKAVSSTRKAEDELTSEQRQRANALKASLNKRCGKLPTQGPNINENKCIKALVRGYSDDDIHDVEHYLIFCDFKWSKDENKYSIRGNILLEKMEPTLRLFAEKPILRTATTPPAPPKSSSAPQGMKYRKLPDIPDMLPPVAILVAPSHVPQHVLDLIGG
jgi:hypothetical protein